MSVKFQYRVTYRTEYTTKVATKETWLPCTVATEDLSFAEFLLAKWREKPHTLDAPPTDYRIEHRTVTTSEWST